MAAGSTNHVPDMGASEAARGEISSTPPLWTRAKAGRVLRRTSERTRPMASIGGRRMSTVGELGVPEVRGDGGCIEWMSVCVMERVVEPCSDGGRRWAWLGLGVEAEVEVEVEGRW